MLPFGVTIPVTVPQRAEIPEGIMNNPELYISMNKTLDTGRIMDRTFSGIP
jgi:hypothetical protein